MPGETEQISIKIDKGLAAEDGTLLRIVEEEQKKAPESRAAEEPDLKDYVNYNVIGPSDHGTTSLFIRDYHGFVRQMLKARTVKLSVPFYQQGNVVFEFGVSDFDSAQYLNESSPK